MPATVPLDSSVLFVVVQIKGHARLIIVPPELVISADQLDRATGIRQCDGRLFASLHGGCAGKRLSACKRIRFSAWLR